MAPSDDVTRTRRTYLQMSSPEIYSRRFSEFVKHFRGDDLVYSTHPSRRFKYTAAFRDELHMPQKRELRPLAADVKRNRHTIARRGSDTAVLPPINTGRSDSNPGVPFAINGTTRSNMSTPFTGQSLASKDDSTSPTPRREKQGAARNASGVFLEMNKSQEMIRLSPKASSDRKSKTDTKADQKTANLTHRGSIPKLTIKSSHVDSHRNDKSKVKKLYQKHLSKSKATEEPFSIRRKIEQYRRWHEEQYMEKLNKLKHESEPKTELENKNHSETANVNVETDLSRMFEESSKTQTLKSSNEKQSADVNNNFIETDVDISAILGLSRSNRHKSARTWKTWRDVNESDAYSDVKKYIEENALMTPEKASWIRNWVFEVERAMFTADSVFKGLWTTYMKKLLRIASTAKQ